MKIKSTRRRSVESSESIEELEPVATGQIGDALSYINSAINVLSSMVADGCTDDKVMDSIVNLGVVLVDLKG